MSEESNGLNINPFETPGVSPAINEEWAAKRRVANASRDLMEALVGCTTDAKALNTVADQLLDQVKLLQQSPVIKGRVNFEKRHNMSEGGLGYELNPLDGQSNPIAAPLDIWFEEERVHGSVTMGWQYEGPPYSVHGGMVAALFDQLLGVGQKLTGQPGFTGTLTTRYLKPTPIATELRLVGWVDRVEGRKNMLVGEMWAGDVKTATCEGIFISVSSEMYEALLASQSEK